MRNKFKTEYSCNTRDDTKYIKGFTLKKEVVGVMDMFVITLQQGRSYQSSFMDGLFENDQSDHKWLEEEGILRWRIGQYISRHELVNNNT